MLETVCPYACSGNRQKPLGFSYPVLSPALNPINFWWLQKFVLETKWFSPSFQEIWVFYSMLLVTTVTLGNSPRLSVPVSPPFPFPNESTSPSGVEWSLTLCLCCCIWVTLNLRISVAIIFKKQRRWHVQSWQGFTDFKQFSLHSFSKVFVCGGIK